MTNVPLEDRIDDINRKLDIVISEVEAQRRLRTEIEDLRDDLTRVGNDMFRSAIYELEEFNETLETGEVVHLGKQLLRNVGNIRSAFEQLESARDFIADFTGISGDMFNTVLLRMDELDRKGYFDLLRESLNTIDTLVQSFTADDLRRLNETLPIVVGMLKRLTNPEMIARVDTALAVVENYDFDSGRKAGAVKIVKLMTDPQVKKGMVFMLEVFKNIMQEYEKLEGKETPHAG